MTTHSNTLPNGEKYVSSPSTCEGTTEKIKTVRGQGEEEAPPMASGCKSTSGCHHELILLFFLSPVLIPSTVAQLSPPTKIFRL